MLEWQLLAVLALHNRPIFVQRVQREVIQVAEGEQDHLCLPLDGEVGIVLDRIRFLLEQIRLQLVVRFAHHLGETLKASTFVHGEDQVNT